MHPSSLPLVLFLLNSCLSLPAFAFATPVSFSADSPPKPMQEHRVISSSQNNMEADARAYNEYASAAIELSEGHVSDNGLFTVTRSVRDIDNNRRRRYLYSILLPKNPSDNTNIPAAAAAASPFISPPVEIHASIQWRLPSPSGAKIAILRNEESTAEASNAGNGELSSSASKTQILEIWVDYGQALQRRIRLPSKKQHGKVISDPGGFGRPAWNVQETALVYPAERNAPETSSFFDDNVDTVSTAVGEGATTTTTKQRGGQYTLGVGKFERWGEKYSQQSPLIDLYCVHVNTGKVGRVENVPGASQCDDKKAETGAGTTTTTTSSTSEGGYSLGQPVFSPDGQSIVYVAWDAGAGSEMPRRLGLIYCQQRPSKLYTSSIKFLMKQLSSEQDDIHDENETESDEGFDVLSSDFRLACSPRFSQMDDKSGASILVFLGSKDGFDTHSGCFALHTMKWNNSGPSLDTLRTVVKEVWDPRDSSLEYGEVAGLRFPGLFLQELPELCFLSSKYLLATTQWGSTAKVVRISIENEKVDLVPCGEEFGSSALVCITPGKDAIVHSKAPNDPGALKRIPADILLGEYFPEDYSQYSDLVRLKPISATRFSALQFESFPFTYTINTQEAPAVEGVDFDLPLQSLLLLPEKSGDIKPPLIVVPHGGPHSALCSNYIHSYAFLCGHGGYAILMVNYRGSTGFGQGSVKALPRFIGDLDVIDVVSVTKHVVASGLIDPNRVGICGGSHGGFLAGHCTSQYPNLFKVAAMRNPVVNIPSMTTATDIPDWCFVEALGEYKWSEYRPPTQAELALMWDKSPIRYLSNVKAPTLVALGLSDLRVPPSQGMEWFHSLRSVGIPCKLLQYEKDDHAIAGVQSEADHWVNIKEWFDKHLYDVNTV